MTEIEQAIKYWEKFKQESVEMIAKGKDRNDILAKQVPMCDIALAALREKAEREKGCTHCQKPYASIGGINEDKAIIYLGAERPYTKGNVEYLHHMDSAGRMNAFKVRHCPMCGKRLEVEP